MESTFCKIQNPVADRRRGGRRCREVRRLDDQLRMRLAYIEDSISRLVKELKQNKCLSQDFEFLTEAEIDQRVEAFVDGFIRSQQ